MRKRNIAKIITLAVLLVLAIVMGKLLSKTSFGADNEESAILEGAFDKYVNYELEDGSKGTLVQYSIRTGINYGGDFFAVRNSELNITLNQIDGKYPNDVKVIAESTKATNGKISDISEDYSYDSSTGILTIRTSNENENGEPVYNQRPVENDRDEFVIISYYDTFTQDKIERDLSCDVTYKAILFTDDNREVLTQGRLEQKVTDDVGELTSVDTNISDIYNGYMKSNIINGTAYDTEYTENNKITISKKEAHQKVKITEENTFVNPNDIEYKSTKILKDDILNVLGENGEIDILDGNNNVIATIDNNTEFNENGEYIVAYGEDVSNITIKTSNIENEGILHIENVKKIRSDELNLSDKDITRKISIIGINEKEEIVESNDATNINIGTLNLNTNNSNSINNSQSDDKEETRIVEEESYKVEKEDVIEVKDSTTNVSVNVDNINWTNEGQNSVNFVVTLDSSTAKNNLFKNPTIRIDLPKEIEKVILGNSQLVYGNGLSLGDVYTQTNEDGTVSIFAIINGIQEKYLENNIGLNTTLTIPMEIMVGKDIENSFSAIVPVIYTNEYTGEEGQVNQGVQIEAFIGKEENINNNVSSQNGGNIGAIIEEKNEQIMQAVMQNVNVDEYGLEVNVEAYKGDENKILQDGDVVYPGEYITYRITYSSQKNIEDLKFKLTIPEELTYGKVHFISDDIFNRSYEYEFFDEQREVEVNAGRINAGTKYIAHVDCRVNDLLDGESSKNIEATIKTLINNQEVEETKINNNVEKEEGRIFIKPYIDGYGGEWYYDVIINAPEGKESTAKLFFPEGVNIDQETIDNYQSFILADVPYKFETDEETGRAFVNITLPEGGDLTLGVSIKILDESKIIELYRESLKNYVSDEDVNMRSYATLEVDGKTYYSNEGKIKRKTYEATVTMTSENEGEEVEVGEEINYNINVKCTSTEAGSFGGINTNIIDYLPENVEINSITYEYFETVSTPGENGSGTVTGFSEKKTNTEEITYKKTDADGNVLPDVNIQTWIPEGESINILVNATAGYVYERTEVENSATIQDKPNESNDGDSKVAYINPRTSNIVKHIIVPKKDEAEEPVDPDNPDNPDEPDNPDNPDNPDTPDVKYDISGVAWNDVNRDGQRQATEELLSGIQVLLVDLEDSSNVKAQATTTNGKYEFKNLESANYIVVFRYNTTLYMLTDYKKSGVLDEKNSDAMAQTITLDGKKEDVAVTDEIVLNQNENNIDIGLIEKDSYDLKLDKYITDVTVTTVNGTKQYSYDNTKLGRVEIRAKELNGAEVSVKYKIVITNEGKASATVKEIYDYIPEGLEFSASENSSWIETDGILVNKSLSGQTIGVGETKEVTLTLTKTMNEENTGTFKNAAEIGKVGDSELGIKDTDSTPGNRNVNEDDYSEAELIIGVSTGLAMYITIGVIIILIIATIIAICIKFKIKPNKAIKMGLFLITFAIVGISSTGEVYAGIPQYASFRWYAAHSFVGGPAGSATCNAYWLRAAGTGCWHYGGSETNTIFVSYQYRGNRHSYTVEIAGSRTIVSEPINLQKLNERIEVRKIGSDYVLGPFEVSSNSSNDCSVAVYDKSGGRIDGWAACDADGNPWDRVPGNTTFYLRLTEAQFDRGVSRVTLEQSKEYVYTYRVKKYASVYYYLYDQYVNAGCEVYKYADHGPVVYAPGHQSVYTSDFETGEETETHRENTSDEIYWDQFNSTLDLIKVDKDDHEIVIDIEGNIVKDDGSFNENFTTVDGLYHWDNLIPGDYTITETGNDNYGYEDNVGLQVTVPVPSGEPVRYEFENTKYTGNLKIVKKDKDSGSPMADVGYKLQAEEGYVIGIDDNGNKITTARGQVHFSDMDYTQDISQATEFFTDDNGVSEILNIRIGTYTVIETSIKIDKYGYELDDNYIFWSSNMGSGQGAVGQVEVVRRKSFITTPKNHTLTDSDYDIITFENRRKWIKLSGDVWEDMISGKTSERDYRYTSGDSTENNPDKLVANVTVKLKDASGNTVPFKTEETASNVLSGNYDGSSNRGTTVNEILTDENGHYLMVDILIDEIPNYYIEFSYNGMSYASVPVIEALLNNEKGGTKAIENADVRAEFNRKYSEITHSGTTGPVGESRDDTGRKTYDLNYDTDEFYDGSNQRKSTLNYGPNAVYGYDGQKFPINMTDEQYMITATTRDAYLSVAGNSGYLDDMYTPDEIRKQEIEEIENVDLGIYEREQPDLALIEDIETVQVSLNGYVHTYNYDQRFSAVDPVQNGGFNVGVKFANEYGSAEYTQTIYSSDVVYNGQNPESLEVYVRYKIALRNEATDLYTRVNDLINFYDNRYTIDSIEDEEGHTFNYTDEGTIGDYKKATIEDVNQDLESQKVKYVYITYKLNNDAINAVLNDDQEFVNNPLDSVTEIASYSTFTDGFSTHYAGVDKDSRPGSAEPANEETFEDDTDSAPAFKLVLEEGRVISGTVWEDEALQDLLNITNDPSNGVYKERKGNGEYEQGAESVVNGVTVDLIVLSNTSGEISSEELANADLSGELSGTEPTIGSLYQREDLNNPVPATTTTGTNPDTGENGYYEFSGVIPGAYLLRFTYGNESIIVRPDGTQEQIEDVDKYKSTIYRGGSADNIGDEYWYRTETSGEPSALRWSDARDQVGINGNGKYDLLADRFNNTKRFYYGNTGVANPETLTAIESRSRGFEIKMDYDVNLDNMSTYAEQDAGLKFIFDNMDFGIIRRPIQRLDLNKEISYIKVTLANGQVVIEGDPRTEQIDHVRFLPDGDGDGCGDVHIELDSEIMQGATLTVTYDIIADTMDSEVDYKTEDYYIYGIPSSNIDDIIAPGIERLFDYLSNEISYDETNQTNIDSGWENIRNESMFETLVEDGYLSQEAFDAIKEYNQVLSTNAFADMKIERRVEHLEVSKVLSNTAEDLIFDNDLEVNILTGRRTTKEEDDDEYTIPGDYVPSNGPTGGDDDYRYVTVTPPTGENQNYMPYIILGISAFIILGTGIIFIKKKVL